MQFKKGMIILLLWVSFFQSSAFAWNYFAHELVANIAYQQLQPKAKWEVDRLSSVLKPYYPRTSTFITSSTFADVLKKEGVHAFDQWHYIDTPYAPTAFKPNAIPRTENVVFAIEQSYSVLRSKQSNDFEKALFLRFFIHFVGDVHQPLHAISLYNSRWPNGDKGGTLYRVRSKFGDNLHQVWDNGVGLFQSYHGKGKRDYFTKRITTLYPASYFGDRVKNTQSQQWAKESYQLAIQYVYKLQGGELSQQYMDDGQRIVSQRIALAGYRLGYRLNELFKGEE